MADQNILQFTEEDCQQILESCFETKDVKYLWHVLKSLSGDVEGYLAEHYSIEITYALGGQSATKKFFAKGLANHTGFLAKFAESMDVFKKEAFVYNYLLKEFEKISPHFKPFAPKCYLARENTLVLEDLRENHFNVGERLKLYDLTQCKMTLKTIAKYHVYSIIYEELKSRESGKTFRLSEAFPEEFEERYFVQDPSSLAGQFIKAGVKSLCRIVDEISDDKCPNKEEFKKLLKKEDEEDQDNRKIEEKFRFTCSHSDLWANNIMFKYENEKLVDCRLIDFQLLRYALPAFDVELFLSGNTSSELRKKHKMELYKFYYDCLKSECSKHEVNMSDILTFEEFLDTAILAAPRAKNQALCDMAVLFFPEEFHLKAAENPDFLKTLLIDEKDRYMAQVFNSNSEFREIFTEELLDLQVSLEEKQKLLQKFK